MLQLKKVPNIPVSTREEHRGFCHNSRGAPISPPQLEMRVPFPASSGKDSRHSRRISRRGNLNRKVERNYRGHATFPKDPQMSQSTPDELDFQELPQLSTRVMTQPRWNVCQPGDTSRESHRTLCQFVGMPDTAATAWEQSERACLHSR